MSGLAYLRVSGLLLLVAGLLSRAIFSGHSGLVLLLVASGAIALGIGALASRRARKRLARVQTSLQSAQ